MSAPVAMALWTRAAAQKYCEVIMGKVKEEENTKSGSTETERYV